MREEITEREERIEIRCSALGAAPPPPRHHVFHPGSDCIRTTLVIWQVWYRYPCMNFMQCPGAVYEHEKAIESRGRAAE